MYHMYTIIDHLFIFPCIEKEQLIKPKLEVIKNGLAFIVKVIHLSISTNSKKFVSFFILELVLC